MVQFASMGGAGEEIAQRFLAEVATSHADAPRALHKAVKKKSMKLVCFQATDEALLSAGGPLYILMVVGHSDFILEKLGKESGM